MTNVPEEILPVEKKDIDYEGIEFPTSDSFELEGIDIRISGSADSPYFFIESWEGEKNVALWTVVYYLREKGIPGVWKESIVLNGEHYRLGALYLIAGFELNERESDYIEYGERPLKEYRSSEYPDETLERLENILISENELEDAP